MSNLSKNKTKDYEKPLFDAGYGAIICSQSEYFVHGSKMLESFLVAIVMHTKKAIAKSAKDIKLFNAYNLKTNKFFGSMYAIKLEEMYFGTFVGCKDVILCTDDSFRFEEDDKLYIPIPTSSGEDDHFLLCNYQQEDGEISPKALIRKLDAKEVTLLSFSKNAELSEALKKCVDLVDF